MLIGMFVCWLAFCMMFMLARLCTSALILKMIIHLIYFWVCLVYPLQWSSTGSQTPQDQVGKRVQPPLAPFCLHVPLGGHTHPSVQLKNQDSPRSLVQPKNIYVSPSLVQFQVAETFKFATRETILLSDLSSELYEETLHIDLPQYKQV